jgi:hypothetical protein
MSSRRAGPERSLKELGWDQRLVSPIVTTCARSLRLLSGQLFGTKKSLRQILSPFQGYSMLFHRTYHPGLAPRAALLRRCAAMRSDGLRRFARLGGRELALSEVEGASAPAVVCGGGRWRFEPVDENVGPGVPVLHERGRSRLHETKNKADALSASAEGNCNRS